jgi:hypothetical protein
MITLSLLKYLEDNGFGHIDQDLFWQKLGLDKDGVYVANIGDSQERGKRRSQSFELYSRGKSDIASCKKLEEIVKFLDGSYGVCRLPAVPPVLTEGFDRVTIMPASTVSNAGLDANGRILWSATGTIYY